MAQQHRMAGGQPISNLRKVVTVVDEVVLELGRPVAAPVRRVAAAAVIRNPWAGRGFVADLQPDVEDLAPGLGRLLAGRLIETLGGVERIESFGKAAVVGLDGEIEHGGALIHTPYFGNVLRELAEGTSIIVFSDDRLAAGEPLTVPVWHKTAAATRSHYQTVQIRIPDAPRPDEIVVIAAAASGPRPNARIGDRRSDPVVRLADLENAR
ncbi:amino acid synthesis family protein [Streptomyces kunmingensis]|uniref:Amino acid synthesis family protein n=1 Tax=Streptomyces kunmingensis TaxID=68225 RepID=A0ABU6CT33_9ACTN|nr:amino acid synthesis family protein [Streptomyces kunmingensis]MEB3967141.1 amino acid synthesis family protein [Streptomyces kunmingensis]